MFDGLRRSEKARVERRCAFILFHDFLAFLDNAFDRVALLAARGFAEDFENLLKPLDLGFRLALMLLKGGAQLLGIRGLCHFGQGFVNLLFGVVDVFEGVEEEVVKVLVGHGISPANTGE